MQKRLKDFSYLFEPPGTFLFYLILYLSGVLILGLFRFGFLVRYHNLASGIPLSILFQSFVIGTRFDMVVLSYLIIPFFFLSSLPLIGLFRFRVTRYILLGILFLCFSLLFLLTLVDLEYFSVFGTRLNLWALEYLDHPDFVFYSIWSSFPVIPYLIFWALTSMVFLLLMLRLSSKTLGRKGKVMILSEIFYFILACFLLFSSARGRLKLAPIDWGLAYFSQYGFANQLALNGIHTLGKTTLDEYKESTSEYLAEYRFFDDKTALIEVQKRLVRNNEKLVDSLDSIRRFVHPDSLKEKSSNPNVVIIFLESWLTEQVGVYGGKFNVTPNFDSLAYKGILFENFYATGTRTNRGLLSVLCSFPSQPGRTLMKKFKHNQPFISLSHILKLQGYKTIFIYGGDLQFDNMQGFFRQQGFDHFIGQDDFSKDQSISKWGIPDDIVFNRALEEFSEIEEEPFLGVILTLSNHEPFVVPQNAPRLYPDDFPNSKYLNAFYYSDWSLGRFFQQAEKMSFFENTLFILVADHGVVVQSQSDLPLKRFHIACLIYSPKFLGVEPKRIKTVASQTDLLPTFLNLLGNPVLHQSWGRDIFSLSPEDKGFAMLADGKRIGWIEEPYFLVDRLGATSSLYNYIDDPEQQKDISSNHPEITEKLRRSERSFLQLSVMQSAEKYKNILRDNH
ncbi:MAG: sulfatase-like hydrolase/transferase [candidate division Zixibacteria bacterium]|nr:sulfatase-like hydrolase/transferase [candidate division Zixibacteria bacterium]